LIDRLEECHDSGYLARYTGACNDFKRALDNCLKQEREDRTKRNQDASKLRTQKHEETRKKYSELQSSQDTLA